MAQRFSAVAWNTIGRGSGFDSRCMHAFLFVFFCRKFKFLANCSTILNEGQRPCLERRSRRSLGLSRAEGPVGHVRRILGTLGEYWTR